MRIVELLFIILKSTATHAAIKKRTWLCYALNIMEKLIQGENFS